MMDQPGENPDEQEAHPSKGAEERSRRQVYFVTIDWLDQPHEPESTEHLARVVAHALEHRHGVGPSDPPARFVVRVKTDDVATEVEGKIEHHHHH